MSLARKAVRGAVWTILSSVGARLLGVVGTLVLTHLIAPDIVGEVSVATVLVLSANQFSSFGFGQYVVANPKLSPAGVFQVATLHLGFGLVGVIAVVLIAGPLAPLFDTPDIAEYVPGLAASVLLNRMSVIPERVLIRDMKFGAASIARTLGEVTYVVTAVYLAWRGWGGEAIVAGNVTRSLVRTVIIMWASDKRKWLHPSPLQREVVRGVFRFGTPLWLGSSASFFAGKWDNLVFAGLFGPHQLGLYTLGYNLADIPTSHVGEHIGDVLLPSFTRMDKAGQRRALVRSAALLALIVFPLAIGLGAVADTLVASLFNEEWQDVAIYLAILSALSVARPVGWIIFSFLQACHRTRAAMVLEIGKLSAIIGSIAALSALGPYWAAGGVGLGFAAHALASLWLIQRTDGVPMARMLGAMVGPLTACVPMVGAVLAVRYGLGLSRELPLVGLILEITAGAAAYVTSCFFLARSATRDFLGLLRQSFRRGARPDTAPPDAAPPATVPATSE
ncbi:MAG TPA: oligosaccharide flippase family protein [Geminicoccaceae bacterium]|nr:oligosaccharide flippase family protein [Geminicoccaceae bacterium]